MVVVGLNGSKMTDYLRLNYYSNGDKGIFRESDAGLPLGYAAWLVQEPASKRTQPPQVFLRPVGGKRQGRAARMKASITNGSKRRRLNPSQSGRYLTSGWRVPTEDSLTLTVIT